MTNKFRLALLFAMIISSEISAQTTVNCYVDASVGDASITDQTGALPNPTGLTLDVFRDNDPVNPDILKRTYLKFDLSAIPPNAIITDAKLKLTPISVTSSPVTFGYIVQRVKAPAWNENTLDWASQPGGYTVDEEAVTSGTATSLTTHEITLLDHVQNMVHYPFNNHGWVIKLDDETISSDDYGVTFHSSNAASNQPVLEVEYVLPLSISVNVTHCTTADPAPCNGTATLTLSGGTGDYHSISVKNVERDLLYDAAQKFGSYTYSLNKHTTGTISSTIILPDLEPGLYFVDLFDEAYHDPSGLYDYPQDHFRKYQYFLVGREGEVTECIIARYGYIDNVKIGDNLGTFVPDDYANTNFFRGSNGALAINHTGTTTHGSSSGVAYQSASLINLNIDVPADLEFVSADLHLRQWTNFYQTHTSSNAFTISPVTDYWQDHVVTWNSRPGIDAILGIDIPKSATPNGYTIPGTPEEYYVVVDILSFMDYWKINPNYGVDLSLTDYTYPTRSDRSMKGINKNLSYFLFSFTVAEPETTTYANLTRKLQGGYYQVPDDDDILHVKYVEEYIDADGNLNFNITDKTGTVQTITTPTVENGDNRIDFDVSTLSAGYYILEISNDKNEQFYLRFKIV